jgi:hypothetical protein
MLTVQKYIKRAKYMQPSIEFQQSFCVYSNTTHHASALFSSCSFIFSQKTFDKKTNIYLLTKYNEYNKKN